MTYRRWSPALVLATGSLALSACGLTLYGASFDYPDEPPVPPGATVVTGAEGWDDDDPMRGREVVIDVGSADPATVVAFYRERFPADEGWRDGEPEPDMGGGHLACLVSHAADDYDEYVELYPYDDGYSSAAPGRYLVSRSRLRAVGGDERTAQRCGLAGIWFPSDL